MDLQDRRAGRTPRWRGVTLAQELLDAGLPVAMGGDNCRDGWYPFGDHDMIDTLQQGVRVFQLDAPIAKAVAMGGPIPAGIIRTDGAGHIRTGAAADFIILNARSLNEAMCRPQSDRVVIRAGKPIQAQLPAYAELDSILDPAPDQAKRPSAL
jgi:cytosine deaminase